MSSTLRVTVHHISIPPMSTLGYGEGVDDHGRVVEFVGDRRSMLIIGESLDGDSDDDVIAHVPTHCILDIRPLGPEKAQGKPD